MAQPEQSTEKAVYERVSQTLAVVNSQLSILGNGTEKPLVAGQYVGVVSRECACLQDMHDLLDYLWNGKDIVQLFQMITKKRIGWMEAESKPEPKGKE